MLQTAEINHLRNYVAGEWRSADTSQEVRNPATGQVIARVPLSAPVDIDEAVRFAGNAFQEWRQVPVPARVQYLFKLKDLLESHQDEIAHLITDECGKTFTEAIAELRRGIENLEVACGLPFMIQGYNN